MTAHSSKTIVLVLALSACDWSQPLNAADAGAPVWMSPQEVERDEEALAPADVEGAWERRLAFTESGVRPEVPVDLGREIGAENLEFVGYAEIGRESVDPPADEVAKSTCEDDVEALISLAEMPVWGYFINSAGETWRWRPQDPVATYMDIRRANRDEFIELAVPSVVPTVQGADQAEPQGADDGEGGSFRAEGIIGSDDRKIRSAHSGHSMTSVNQSWVRMGGLPTDGWDLDDQSIDNTMGTATKIGPRHLLTSGHVVWKDGFFFPKDWWAGEDGVAATSGLAVDDTPNGVKNIAWYFIAPKWYEDEKNSHDFAVLVLYDNASSAQFPSFGFKEDYALAGESMWNFGIPWPDRDCLDSPLADDNCRSSMYGHAKDVRRTEVSYVFTAHDMQGGHSGGPVYKWDGGERNIVAIAKSEYSAVENRHLRIRGLVFDTLVSAMNAHPSSFCGAYKWTGPGCK